MPDMRKLIGSIYNYVQIGRKNVSKAGFLQKLAYLCLNFQIAQFYPSILSQIILITLLLRGARVNLEPFSTTWTADGMVLDRLALNANQ